MSVSTYTSEWKNRTKAQLLDDIQIVIEQRDKAVAKLEAARVVARHLLTSELPPGSVAWGLVVAANIRYLRELLDPGESDG